MKISKILPQSPRVSKMDTEFATAARPGAPTFGRTPGLVTNRDRVTISSEGRDLIQNFKDTSKVLPVDFPESDLNIQANLLTDDVSTSESEVFKQPM